MNLEKVYYDMEGRKRTILQMVKEFPEWAANRIQDGEKATEEVNNLKAIIRDLERQIGRLDDDVCGD